MVLWTVSHEIALYFGKLFHMEKFYQQKSYKSFEQRLSRLLLLAYCSRVSPISQFGTFDPCFDDTLQSFLQEHTVTKNVSINSIFVPHICVGFQVLRIRSHREIHRCLRVTTSLLGKRIPRWYLKSINQQQNNCFDQFQICSILLLGFKNTVIIK